MYRPIKQTLPLITFKMFEEIITLTFLPRWTIAWPAGQTYIDSHFSCESKGPTFKLSDNYQHQQNKYRKRRKKEKKKNPIP